jgi:hypothetical protein
MKYAIATFCYGERYYNQVNRLINSFTKNKNKPPIIVVTDNVDSIVKDNNVSVFDVREFNPEYSIYSDSYYTFDFSVKRYSLQAALNLGYNKIILTDADAVVNESLFSPENALKGFVNNSIQGQVTYDFTKEIMTNSMLGRRFLEYEKQFNVSFNKYDLKFMPEDCIQFIEIDTDKFYGFLNTWGECIKIKNNNNLPNVPAGNIDEMCFAAFMNGVTVGNNSDKVMNLLINIHDKWYSEPSPVVSETLVVAETSEISKTIKKKKIVTSVYLLNYITERGGGGYKGIDLLTQTIRNILFDDYEYVVYTNEDTYNKTQLKEMINHKNVTFKFVELNSNYFNETLKPIQQRRVSEGEIWDRIYSVDHYIEVILNKLEFLVSESIDYDGDVVWIDSGLFGTSCNNGWRDYMNVICHTDEFLSKVFDKINDFEFISLKGEHILINYVLKDKLNNIFNTNFKIIPGGIFGGNSTKNIELLSNYKVIYQEIIDKINDYVSEQELLFLLLNDKIKTFDFDDWDDLQKGVLKIMDLYDETSYDKCSSNTKEITEDVIKDVSNMTMTELADYCGIDKGTLHENHQYTKTYESLLKKYKSTKPTILEIGINDPRFPGGCLKFWDLYFNQMNYYGFDIVDCSVLKYNREKITTFVGDQNNPDDLLSLINQNGLSENLDVIIDDGSHISEHIITSFKTLFPHLKKGGLYFVEDLHAGWAEKEKTLPELKRILSNFEGSEYYEVNDKLFYVIK